MIGPKIAGPSPHRAGLSERQSYESTSMSDRCSLRTRLPSRWILHCPIPKRCKVEPASSSASETAVPRVPHGRNLLPDPPTEREVIPPDRMGAVFGPDRHRSAQRRFRMPQRARADFRPRQDEETSSENSPQSTSELTELLEPRQLPSREITPATAGIEMELHLGLDIPHPPLSYPNPGIPPNGSTRREHTAD